MSGEKREAQEARDQRANQQQEQQSGESRGQSGEARATAGLDFANLDLSVEAVEERISPSETNVFDK